MQRCRFWKCSAKGPTVLGPAISEPKVYFLNTLKNFEPWKLCNLTFFLITVHLNKQNRHNCNIIQLIDTNFALRFIGSICLLHFPHFNYTRFFVSIALTKTLYNQKIFSVINDAILRRLQFCFSLHQVHQLTTFSRN